MNDDSKLYTCVSTRIIIYYYLLLSFVLARIALMSFEINIYFSIGNPPKKNLKHNFIKNRLLEDIVSPKIWNIFLICKMATKNGQSKIQMLKIQIEMLYFNRDTQETKEMEYFHSTTSIQKPFLSYDICLEEANHSIK